jgi:predicted PurR-regulated permease PerM
MYIAQSIIVPLVFATIIAIVLHPLVNLLTRLKINRILAISIVLTLTFLIIFVFSALIFRQLTLFTDSWPALSEKFTSIINQTITDAAIFYDINPQSIHNWIETAKDELYTLGSAAIGQTLYILGNSLVVLFLIPVYVFLILFYQPLLRDFIFKLFDQSQQQKVSKIVTQSKVVIQRYLIGLIIEFIIVAALNTVALLILGIKYPILLGIIGALLNIIPYLGGIISVFLFAVVALVSKSPDYVIYVIGAYSIIQFVDNNYIIPKIVASKVKINALFSVIVVIAGNALWGISGMFLSIPLLAIIKLLCDNIDPLKPWGFLLGDTMPPIININPIIKKIKAKL